MKVLVVDDDEDTTVLLSLAFERQGWSVDAVSTVASARSALSENRYSVLITDLHLADGSGMSLLREPPPYRLEAAIVITGECDEQQRKACLEIGFARCLTKPLSGSEIVNTVLALIGDMGLDA